MPTFTIGASGADYTSLANCFSARQGVAVAGVEEIYELIDSTAVGATAINYVQGAIITIRSSNPFNGSDFSTGTRITSQLTLNRPVAGSTGITYNVEGVVLDGDDYTSFAQALSLAGDNGNCTFNIRNCGVIDGKANWRGIRVQPAGSYTHTVNLDNVVFKDALSEAVRIDLATVGTLNVVMRGVTALQSRFMVVRATGATLNLSANGSIIEPNTGSELNLSGSGGTLTFTAEETAFSRAQAAVDAEWTATNCEYSVGMVTGTPAAGQIGFTNLATDDCSLVDHVNNVAIGLAATVSMPATDAAGTVRGSPADAGALEAAPLGTAPDAPTDFTAGATTSTALTFSWTDVATDEDNYEVEYQVDGAGSWTVWDAALPADTETDTITGLTAATIYNIRVRATNAFGDSSWLTGQMTTDAAPEATTGARRGGMGLAFGLGLGRSRRGGAGASGSSTLYWSAASSWAGGVPEVGEDVTIPAGTTIVLDEDTAALGSLTVEGTLVVQAGATVTMTTGRVMVDGGVFQCGTEATPFTGNFTLTLTGTTPSHTTDGEDGSKLNNGLTRAVMVTNGGVLDLHGNVPSVAYTRINAHIDVSVDDNTIVLSEAVDWPVGAKIILSKTDYYSVGNTEELTIAARPDSTTITTVESIATDRWGVMQYATDSGMSLTPGTLTRNDPDTPTTLDERATVALLTRNIVIQGANDTTWSTDGIGGHTMVDDNTCTYRLQGVEFRRMGQKHSKGRYPIHFHMLSWGSYLSPESGDWLGEAPAERFYAKKCSVAGSMNRGCVIHGTHGVLVEDNVFFDIKGHAVFEEDGAEEDNIIQRNCVMKVRDPGSGFRIKSHDSNASGFWLVNPNNKVRQNIASDCQGRGFWNSFAEETFGLSRDVTTVPIDIVIDEFDDNIGHSNALQGFMTNEVVINEAGGTNQTRYLEGAPVTTFTAERNQSWKNSSNGYDNRVMKGLYNYWTMADNDGPTTGSADFFGSSLGVAINRGPLLINNSLNNATAKQSGAHNAVASYHFEMDFVDIVAIGYELVTPVIWGQGQMVQGGGVLNGGDLYTNGAYYQMGRSSGWTLINSSAGHLPISPVYDGFALYPYNSKYRYWTIGVLHDPHGYWTTAGHWILPDRDLYTYGLTTTTISDQTSHVSAEAHIYGVERVQTDLSDGIGFSGSAQFRMIWHRLDTSNTSIDSHEVGPGADSVFFNGMRSFVANRAGRFLLEFPDTTLGDIDQISIVTRLCHKTEDWFLLGIPWDGARVPTRVSLDTSGPTIGTANRTISLSGTSIADVLADTSGATGWQDTANDIIWVQVRGTESGSYAYTDPETTTNNSITQYARYLRIVA